MANAILRRASTADRHLTNWLFAGVLLLACGSLAHGAERVDSQHPLVAGSVAVAEVQNLNLHLGDTLEIHWQADGERLSTQPRLQLTLLDTEGRWFHLQRPIPLAYRLGADTVSIPLTAALWSGSRGVLDAHALAGVTHVQLRCEGLTLRSWRISRVPHLKTTDPTLVQMVDRAAQRQGPWYRWRFRLLGGAASASVSILLADGQRIPAFANRDLHGSNLGPALWEVRLRPHELDSLERGEIRILSSTHPHAEQLIGSLRLEASDHSARPLVTAEPPWPWAHSPPWQQRHLIKQGDQRQVSGESLPPALAPWLRWQDGWTGFAGPRRSGTTIAQAWDGQLAAGEVTDIDLLAASLADRAATFRWQHSPWADIWEVPQDIFRRPQQDLIDHARELLARSRAAPDLERWRIGLHAPSDGTHGVDGLIGTIAALVTTYDDRPVHILHPEFLPFAEQKPWLHAPAQGRLAIASDGLASMSQSIDRSMWPSQRQRLRLRYQGSGGATVYATMVDGGFRYYQQKIAYIPTPGHWQVADIDLSSDADWVPAGHEEPWQVGSKRRVRSLGLIAASDQSPPANAAWHLDWAMLDTLALPLHTAAAEGSMRWHQKPADRAEQWQPFTLHFDVLPLVDNPYDPEQADVRMELIAPDDSQHSFPAFWLEPHRIDFADGQESVTSNGRGHWAWRYTFAQAGTWRLRLQARCDGVTISSPWHTISVGETASALLPVERSADPRYWQTSDGAWFYPMGVTIRSPGDERQNVLLRRIGSDLRSAQMEAKGTEAYAHWFARIAENGGNFVRIWMSPWWTGLEWHRDWTDYHGLGRYNQANAARMDRLVELAAQHGIYLQLELLNHGMTSETVDEQWHPDPQKGELGSPYNRVNGGPLVRAADYYSAEEAWVGHRNRLRYTVARWGHAPQIMAWVLSSEMEFTGAFWNEAYMSRTGQDRSPTLEAWIQRNLDWFTSNDHFQRPVSVHFSHPWRAASLWRSLDLGFSYSNAYTGYQRAQGQLGHPRSGLGGALLTYIRSHFPPWELGRPTMIGEWGGHWQETDPEVLAAEWRSGLWMQAVLPYAGNTGFWWWLWADGADAWRRMAPVRQFVTSEDPRGHDLQPIIPRIIPGESRAQMLGSGNDERIVAYAYLRGLDRETIISEGAGHAGTAIFRTTEIGQRWRWQRFSTQSGLVEDSGEIISNDDWELRLDLGVLQPDAAFRLHLMRDEQASQP